MKTYVIHGEIVTPRVIMRPMDSPMGKEYSCNVLTYQGEEYDITWNNDNDGWILIDGKKRYLETA